MDMAAGLEKVLQMLNRECEGLEGEARLRKMREIAAEGQRQARSDTERAFWAAFGKKAT